jgi:hypothetical protein
VRGKVNWMAATLALIVVPLGFFLVVLLGFPPAADALTRAAGGTPGSSLTDSQLLGFATLAAVAGAAGVVAIILHALTD